MVEPDRPEIADRPELLAKLEKRLKKKIDERALRTSFKHRNI